MSAQSRRHISLHEHHSMELMSSFGISVPRGELANTPEQARDITHRLGAALLDFTNMHLHVHIHSCKAAQGYVYSKLPVEQWYCSWFNSAVSVICACRAYFSCLRRCISVKGTGIGWWEGSGQV